MSAPTGKFTDSRDGQVYRTVLMPDGKWWGGNLNWAGAGRYYNDDPANGPIYGELYTWGEALASCPPGSHLPGDAEWTTLETAIPDPDGTKLKANSSLWASNTGSDDYGFAAFPGGWLVGTSFFEKRYEALFWSQDGYLARSLRDTNSGISRTALNSTFAASVRFIVDSGNIPDTAPTPSIYPASGTMQGVQLVVIQGRGTIRYTLDGSEPTASSPIYTGPFRLSSPTTVKAKAFQNSLESTTTTSVLVIQGADFLKIPSYTDAVLPLLLEQYKGDNP